MRFPCYFLFFFLRSWGVAVKSILKMKNITPSGGPMATAHFIIEPSASWRGPCWTTGNPIRPTDSFGMIPSTQWARIPNQSLRQDPTSFCASSVDAVDFFHTQTQREIRLCCNFTEFSSKAEIDGVTHCNINNQTWWMMDLCWVRSLLSEYKLSLPSKP